MRVGQRITVLVVGFLSGVQTQILSQRVVKVVIIIDLGQRQKPI